MTESYEPFLIGVDGGGTGCRAALARGNGQILAQVEGGRANVATDFDLAVKNVAEVIANVAGKGGIGQSNSKAVSIHVGLAGVISKAVSRKVAEALPYALITVTDDRVVAVKGALGDDDGYFMSVGTGTIVASKKAGELHNVSGWGFAVSDQASGAWLGRRLLEKTLLCYDRIQPHTELTLATLARFEGDPNELVAFSLGAKPGDFGAFAPDVMHAAKAGDQIGLELTNEGADYLQSALRALSFDKGDRLCVSGGVGKHYLPYLNAKFKENVIDPDGPPIEGALRLAAEAMHARAKVAS
ncbi:MAG: BadF/BadG/BcrA/BcrD ATPase family protein [Paracoccaceae bacterium]